MNTSGPEVAAGQDMQKDLQADKPAVARFGSGASSSRVKPRYDLIPVSALRRLAERFGFGAEKHGDHNYKQGVFDRAFIIDRINHMIEHASKYAMDFTNSKISTTDHLGAVMCNAAILAELEQMRSQAIGGEVSSSRLDAARSAAAAQREEQELVKRIRETKTQNPQSFDALCRAVDRVMHENASPAAAAAGEASINKERL